MCTIIKSVLRLLPTYTNVAQAEARSYITANQEEYVGVSFPIILELEQYKCLFYLAFVLS